LRLKAFSRILKPEALPLRGMTEQTEQTEQTFFPLPNYSITIYPITAA